MDHSAQHTGAASHHSCGLPQEHPGTSQPRTDTEPKRPDWSRAAKPPKENLQNLLNLPGYFDFLFACLLPTCLEPQGGLSWELGVHFSTWMLLLPRGVETFFLYMFLPLLIAFFLFKQILSYAF